jgi:ankyrin repeat protein
MFSIVAATTVALVTMTYFGAGKRLSRPIEMRVFSKEAQTMEKHIHLENPGPPLKIEQITAFEKEIGGRLPEDYKEFLLAHNGGICEQELGLLWEDDIQTISGFFPLSPEDSGIRCSLRHLREVNPKKADGYLPLTCTTSDFHICLAYKGKNAGKIFFTAYKYKKVGLGDLVPIDVTMVPLADSFSEFLDCLVEIPEHYCRIEYLGKCGTVDDLVKYMAEGNSINAMGKNNFTILCEAVKFDNAAMIKACIEHGANLSGCIEIAVTNRHIHLIEMLVKAGANINERDEFGFTPLHHISGTALPGEEGDQNRRLRKLLIKLGAIDPSNRVENLAEEGTAHDLDRYLAEGNSIEAVGKVYGMTIVRIAVMCNNRTMIDACIKHGASLSGTIDTAIQNFHFDLIEMLAHAGADVNERNELGNTPLYYVNLITDFPGEDGMRNRKLRDLLIKLGAAE